MSRLSHKQSKANFGNLRVYRGPEDNVVPTVRASSDNRSVTAPASVVLPLLADAIASQRTWLQDFDEDEMTISADLYEVLLAYQHYRPVA